LLVDDNVEFLDAATRFLSTERHVQIVGRAHSPSEAMAKVKLFKPELVLMDIALSDCSGLKITRTLKTQPEAPHVVILTLHDNAEYRAAAIAARADGFVSKSDFGEQLLPMIRTLFKLEADTQPRTDTVRYRKEHPRPRR